MSRLATLLVLLAGVTVAFFAAASTPASSTANAPPWESDPNALGSLTFYDANGHEVTGGSIDDHPAAFYIAASGPGRPGDSLAQTWLSTPQVGTDPSNWSKDVMSGATTYPNTSAPANIAALTTPVASPTTLDLSIADYISEFPNTLTTPGYQNLYEFRVYTSGPTQGAGRSYYRADISVTMDPTLSTGTWSVVYSPAPTTVTLSAFPVAKAAGAPDQPDEHGKVTLTATVTPKGAAGSVEFFNGPDKLPMGSLGSYNPDTGVATLDYQPGVAGAYLFSAKFSAGDGKFADSTSDTLRYRIGQPPPAQTTLRASPASPQPAGTAIALTCVVRPARTPGKVTFFDGNTSLGDGTYDDSTGTATIGVNPSGGPHLFTAMFTSSDSDVGNSIANPVQFFLIPPTVVSLTVSPSGFATHGESVTISVTVSPPGPGRVALFDGSHDLGAVTYDPSRGTATLSVTPADGAHSFKAQFVAEGADNGPISETLAYTVGAAAAGAGGADTQNQVPAAAAAPQAVPVGAGSAGPSASASGSVAPAYTGPTPTAPVGGALSSGGATTGIAISSGAVVVLVGVGVLVARLVRRSRVSDYWSQSP
jgi:hypothetical protein